MLAAVGLARRPDFAISAVTCRDDHTGWSAPEVGRAMQRIAAGESQLSRLAAELGFADQAHLSRTVRAHLGHTPTALRAA